MNNIILNKVINIIKQINETKECNNIISTFYPNILNLVEEEKTISEFYSNNIGNWYARCNLEKNHYKFLEAYIIHKIGEVLYFYKNENLTSRKFLIHSTDCISAVQFLSRVNKNILNIFIRSSDAVNLLLADCLFGCKLLSKVLDEFNIKKNAEDEINIWITSCHFYDKDIKLVDNIIKNG